MKDVGYFTGAFLSAEEAQQEPFDNWTELIGLIANVVAASRAMIIRSNL
jgi:hypothetical protein